MNNRRLSFVTIILALILSALSFAEQSARDLSGEWKFGALSFTNYRDAYIGKLSDDGGGIGDNIKIKNDGTYERAARMKMTLYSCTTRLAIWERGTIEVAGQNITFKPLEGSIKSEDNCNAKFNYQKPASTWTQSFVLSIDSYNRRILMLKAENGNPVNYIRQLGE